MDAATDKVRIHGMIHPKTIPICPPVHACQLQDLVRESRLKKEHTRYQWKWVCYRD